MMLRTLLVALAVALLLACGGETPARSDMAMNDDPMAGMDMSGDGPIRISTRQAALAGVTYAVAREARLARTVRAVAMAVPNERGLGEINARVAGWIERLDVNETGQFVQAGQVLFALYAPELVAAQEDLLLARRQGDAPGADGLRQAARRRMAQWGIAPGDIAVLEAGDTVVTAVPIRSAFTGHVIAKHVVEGQMVQPGEPLFRLADLSTIWIEPAVFESDLAQIRVGQRVEVRFDALPGRRFTGRVTFIAPQLDMDTRTLRVRIEVPNRDLAIRPMMFGNVEIATEGPRGVIVPLTAVLPTGTRDLAFVVRGGALVPTEVIVGLRGDATLLIADGLAPGDTVVASATFLFDSESQLAAAMAGIMLNMGMGLDMGGMDMGDLAMPDTGTMATPRRTP